MMFSTDHSFTNSLNGLWLGLSNDSSVYSSFLDC